ncbi:MAG: hypothetical protein ABFS30_12945 [Pseudomonadota bacterium]
MFGFSRFSISAGHCLSRRLLIGGTVLSWALASSVGPARAQDEIKMFNDIRYACTGTGIERNDPAWAGFSLKIIYAVEPRGALLSDVRTTIESRRGHLVLQAYCPDDPWLVADLPAGRYRVTAIAVGRFTKRVGVTVGRRGQRTAVIRFPEAAGH